MQHRIRFRDENWETLDVVNIESKTPDLALAHALCCHNEMIYLYWPKETSKQDLVFIRTGLVPMSHDQVIDEHGRG